MVKWIKVYYNWGNMINIIMLFLDYIDDGFDIVVCVLFDNKWINKTFFLTI